jgi:hypothetical protein
MPKTLRTFRLSDKAWIDSQYCVERAKLRQLQGGFSAPSQAEIVEQALGRLARYYRGLKLDQPAGKGAPLKKK